MRLNAEGDLLMQVENAQLILHKPALYEEVRSRELARKSAPAASPPQRYPIEGAYLFEPDGSIAFRIARRHPHAALVIDPSLSITYSTFLGGAGEDTANSIAADSTGKLYVAGTTTSASTFPESAPATTWPRRRRHRLLHSQNRPHRLRRKLPHLSQPSSAAAEMRTAA